MNEQLLQFIWRLQYFNFFDLLSPGGDRIQVVSPGILNTDQGPDFSNARIRINNAIWAGSVELHIKTSHWNKHRHFTDANYNNVILHVVWHHDHHVNEIPVLELRDRVPKLLLDRYARMMATAAFIPCADQLRNIPELIMINWKDRLTIERLDNRAAAIGAYLEENKLHWEETFWWTLARNFGTKINGEAFESVARSLSLNILARHKHQLIQVEALLLGQAGLLDLKASTKYMDMLKKEYSFLKHKYQLPAVLERVQMLRMRPANFPVIRYAQLAMLITRSAHLFSSVREEENVNRIREKFDVTANDHWSYHYSTDHSSKFFPKRIGKLMIDNIIINTIVPMLYTYGKYYHIQSLKEKAISWLHATGPEKNKITTGFLRSGISQLTAADSQALLELKKNYCDNRRCLNCAIGNQLLKR